MNLPLLPDSTLRVRLAGRLDLLEAPTLWDGGDVPGLADSQKRIEESQRRLWASRSAGLLVILQGLDASGKDGTIRRMTQAMDPMGVRVKGFTKPTPEELAHDFTWRAVPHFPARGEIAIFNRSHYEAVLVERVLAGDSPVAQDGQSWQARYRYLRELEAHLVSGGTRILKVWLHLSADEQRKRLLKRVTNERKQWKFDPSDVDTWQQRERYLSLASAMIAATHSDVAPWHVVPADDKGTMRALVCELVAEALESVAGDYPAPDDALCDRYERILKEK